MVIENLSKVVLIVEYEGTSYYGFQFQAALPTIQSELEEAIYKLTGERLRIMAASRTDTGVHARGQVVSFRTSSTVPLRAYLQGLNHYLPEDIAVRSAFRVNDLFNVRKNAISREYKYFIHNSNTRSSLTRTLSYWFQANLDINKMNLACQALIGKHDFASFVTCMEDTEKSTLRTIFKAEWQRNGDMLIFTILANSFLPHQVRNTAGAMIEVGRGKISVEDFNEIVEAKKPGLAGPTIPAGGLCLVKVNYPEPFEEIQDENL
ncbi:tRNA pseudouridine(38-40) synthase TruA [Chloroflexota bacterium]